jgi:hypothetical protein
MKTQLPPKLLTFLAVLLLISSVVAPVVADHDGYTIGEDNVHHDETQDYKTDYPTHSENPTGEPVIDVPTTVATVYTPSSDRDYGPDYGIPGNGLRVFYSEDTDENISRSSNGTAANVTVDQDAMSDVQSIDTIVSEGQSQNPEEWARMVDMPYYTSRSIVEFYGFRLGEYREHQLLKTPFNKDESKVLEPYTGQTKNDGVIEEGYVGIVGIDSANDPKISPENGEFSMFAGDSGTVFSYLDFKFDESELPDVEVDDIEETSNTQTQTARTYHIEDVSVVRDGKIIGDRGNVSMGLEGGASGVGMSYDDRLNRNVTFQIEGQIIARIFEYNWERSRDRIDDSRTTTVRASKSVSTSESAYASTTVYHGENSSGESISGYASTSCSDYVSGDKTKTVTRTWQELGGDRTINIESEETIGVSGTISGRCSGSVSGTAGSGTSTTISGRVSSDISGSISGSEERTYDYEYWDHWDSQNNTDRGGWELQNKEWEREDRVDVQDTQNALITDNNPVRVDQVAIEVQEDRYHNVVEVDYLGVNEGQNVSGEQIPETYLWSLMMFGDSTFIETDWKSYSKTRYDSAYRVQDNGYYEEVDFPNQLGVYLYSQNTGPSVTSSGTESNYNPELFGWRGDYVDVEQNDMGENVNLTRGVPVLYNKFVIKNAPSPATSLISIHGTQRHIADSETKVIPYVQPDVSIEYMSEYGQSDTENRYRIQVTGVGGEPLEGRDLRIAGGEEEGVRTTNSNGVATVTVGDGVSHIQVEVPSDDVTTVIQDDRDYYYGSVTAEKTVRRSGAVGHLYDLVYQLLFAMPLILLYLLWRDAELGI